MTAPPVDLSSIIHPIVREAITAMNGRNKRKWYELFSDAATLTDDGTPHDLTEWSDGELFGSSLAYLASVDKVEDGGLTIYGRFHSDRWGNFKTFLKFSVEKGRIIKLTVGQASY
jgi:hypothetical protein